MANTPIQDLYIAAEAIIADAATAAEATIAAAPTDFGTDFRITPGTAVYQIRVSPVEDYARSSNDSHPRAVVTVLIHHYVYPALGDEQAFTLVTMSEIADRLLVSSIWGAEDGVFGLDHTVDPDISEGERDNKIITFEINASVLADAA